MTSVISAVIECFNVCCIAMIKTEMAENEINIMSEEDLFKGHVDEKQGSSKN